MAYAFKQLGQLRPGDTDPASLVSPAENSTVTVRQIFVANTTGSAATFRIFVDDDGSTYDQGTALYYDVGIAANATERIDCFIHMDNADGNLGVRSNTANALTFTAFGQILI